VDFTVTSVSATLTIAGGAKSQLIHVLPFNDPPVITNPQAGYRAGCITQTPCVDAAGNRLHYAVFSTNPPDLFFGQYWRYEGSADPLIITGFALDDPDIDEECYFDSRSLGTAQPFVDDPATAYLCGTLNLNVRAAIGSITLNTVDGLTFYSNARSLVGTIGGKAATASALASVTYRVETPEIVISGTSKVLSVNTQFVGAPEEYIILALQDQGLTGPRHHAFPCPATPRRAASALRGKNSATVSLARWTRSVPPPFLLTEART
jgi:hypothetical protein